jgi:hypothetical protein
MVLRIAKIIQEVFFVTGLSTAEQVTSLCSIDIMLCGEQSNSKNAECIMSVVDET